MTYLHLRLVRCINYKYYIFCIIFVDKKHHSSFIQHTIVFSSSFKKIKQINNLKKQQHYVLFSIRCTTPTKNRQRQDLHKLEKM